MFHELLWRDHEDGRVPGQPQGVGSEAYLTGTSQGSTPEDVRKDDHIRGRSKPVMKHPAYSYIINASHYAGLPSSLLWPCQIVTIVDGQIQKEKMGKLLLFFVLPDLHPEISAGYTQSGAGQLN